MFVSYWFVVFAFIFFPIYWFCRIPIFRKYWLLIACLTFHYHFAGPAGVLPILFLGILTYIAGISNHKDIRSLIIVICILELAFYKYSIFFISQIISHFNASYAETILQTAKSKFLPSAPPLAISFFVFEFVHYLVDLQRGKQPIKNIINFTLFSVFWPSVVSGPIKRFEQFVPAIAEGCKRITAIDIQSGITRICIGLIKKLVIADNLTAYINYYYPNFGTLHHLDQWLFLIAISFRILFDFSGYSDIAIGFARLMGITLPENFNWPYFATSVQDFWRRWHISLSTWIRDYVYIPLGGNQYGLSRKIFNGVFAFAICGLWHGAAWNFIFWGLYHGVGLVISSNMKILTNKLALTNKLYFITTPLAWLSTLLFVSIGWLYFFYPVKEATHMVKILFHH